MPAAPPPLAVVIDGCCSMRSLSAEVLSGTPSFLFSCFVVLF